MTYSATVLADSPIRYYRLGETSGTVATDSGSQAQNGTLNGTITLNQTSLLLSDTANGSMLLDGSTGYISAATTGLPTGSQSWSLECWIKIPSVPASGYHVMVAFGTGNTNQAATLYFNTASKAIRANTHGGNDVIGTLAADNTIYHVVGTYDGTTLRLYVNGASVGTPLACTPAIVAGFCYIGAEDASPVDFYSGDIDEVAIYSTALSAARVLAHYNAGILLPRTVPATAALLATSTRTIPATAALLQTNTRTVPATASLSGKTRTVPATAALLATATRTIPATAALLATATRTITTTAALAAQRTVPATAALQATSTRTVTVTAALLATMTRTIGASAALLASSSRTVPASAAVLATTTRTVPATVSLYALSSLTVSISGTPVTLEQDTLIIPDKVDEITQCSFTLADRTGTASYSKGQRVIITDSILGRLFYGEIDTADPLNLVPDPFVWWAITCVDSHATAARRTTNKRYTNQSAGSIVADMYQQVLAAEGVVANVANAHLTTQADWNTGTLTNVVAASSVGDGDLELSGSSGSAGGTFNNSTQWNTGSYANTQTNGADLSLIGSTRNWDDGNTSSQTLYGNGSPTGSVSSGRYLLSCTHSSETRSRLDFAGTWGDGIIEVDVSIGADLPTTGLTWHTTSWGNPDGGFAYALEFTSTKIEMRKGQNSSGGGSTSSLALLTFSPKLSYGTYRLSVVMSGSSFSVYINGAFALSASDGSYASAGYIALRNRNNEPSVTITFPFDNFGVMAAESGTWTSPGTSITTITSIASSSISWDTSLSTGGSVQVQTSTDGGSTYHTATNGGAISGLTPGSSGSGKSIVVKVTLSTSAASQMPDIQNLQWSVSGGYTSPGTRVSPAIDLSAAVRAGSTFIGWNAIVPALTTLGMDISIGNTTSWVDVTGTNGGPIPGIYAQPDPTVDMFTANTSANYIATSRTGGAAPTPTFDTANSRLTLTGGTNGIYLNGAISRADVDLLCDLDQADAGGLVWRFVDASNYYALVIGDASASVGTPNTVTLYKVAANVQTQLAIATISFPRGTYHRFRVTMLAGVITVTMDGGGALFTYTDGSPLAAGQMGLWNNGGATGSRYYQLWLQPQGDSLVGISVYTRQRLATTGAVTPQVLDLTVSAFDPSIGNGALVPQADYLSTFLNANMDDLSKRSDYGWKIDKFVALKFKGRQAVPAPWVLYSNDPLIRDLLVSYGGDLYSNRQVLLGVVDVKTFQDTKIGDGKTQSWVLSYPLAGIPIITLNNTPVSVGVKGIDTGKAYYYAIGDTALAQDSAGTVLISTDTLVITGLGTYNPPVTRDNVAGQAAYATLQGGGTGIVENVTDVSTLGLNIAAAQAYGDALNARYGRTGRTVTFNTTKLGLAPGQLISAFVPQRQMTNVPLLITSVTLTVGVYGTGGGTASNRFNYAVVATELASQASWQKQLVAAMK